MVIRTGAVSGWVFCLTNLLIWVMTMSFEHASSDTNSSSYVGMSVRRNFVVMFSHRTVADIGVSSSLVNVSRSHAEMEVLRKWAADLAALSACSLPLIPAWAGTQQNKTVKPLE
ncbi:hypothetical protein AVEN_189434-1 [Araneus ventricosus]|uniref:Uncharacterized protein n=1 Tax=Araneus ventricosus TaxID=182803 RepID=A0A4Y2WIA0_ARAVE|nr:hypothetical protein AVEN_189434-1 [Araneus ventricosus]